MASGPIPVLTNGQSSNVGIWDTGSTALLTVGTRGVLDDGRVFYYARQSASAAIVAGKLLMSEIVNTNNEDLAVDTHTAGATVINVTSGSATDTANAFAGGYLVVIDDTGEGITYKIVSHPTYTATAAIAFTIEHGLHVAFGAGTTVCLVKNPWMDPVIAAAAQAHFACGIAQVAVAAGNTTAQFYWCQTWGVTCGWQDTTTAAGVNLTSGATAGQVEINGGTDQYIGMTLIVGETAEYQPIFLNIAP